MNRSAKRWLTAAVVLVVIGGLTFVGAFAVLGFDLSKISTDRYETNTYEPAGDFDSIRMDLSTAKVVLAVSEDGSCKVECVEREDENHTVAVENGTLVLRTVAGGTKWYRQFLRFDPGSPAVTVFLPKAEYDSLLIASFVGDVDLSENLSFRSIDVTCDTGDVLCGASASEQMEIRTDVGSIRLNAIDTGGKVCVKTDTGDLSVTGVRCGSFTAESQVGDVVLKSVVAASAFSVETDTGDVRLDGCDGESVQIRTNVGNVTGTFLTDKIIFAETSVGSVDVPKSTTGGKCEITTDTGDIRVKIAE